MSAHLFSFSLVLFSFFLSFSPFSLQTQTRWRTKTSFARCLALELPRILYFVLRVCRVSFDTSIERRTDTHHARIALSRLLAGAKCSAGAARSSSVSCCNGNVAFARTTRLTDPPVRVPVFRSHSTGFKSSCGFLLVGRDATRSALPWRTGEMMPNSEERITRAIKNPRRAK